MADLTSSVNTLKEYCERNRHSIPTYETSEMSSGEYVCGVTIDGQRHEAIGHDRLNAENMAAVVALGQLQNSDRDNKFRINLIAADVTYYLSPLNILGGIASAAEVSPPPVATPAKPVATGRECNDNAMSQLLIYCQRKKIIAPEFTSKGCVGQDHNKLFTMECKIVFGTGELKADGSGYSLKEAKKDAANNVLQKIAAGGHSLNDRFVPIIQTAPIPTPTPRPTPTAPAKSVQNPVVSSSLEIGDKFSNNPKGYLNELNSKFRHEVFYDEKPRPGGLLAHSGYFDRRCVLTLTNGHVIVGYGCAAKRKDAEQKAAAEVVEAYKKFIAGESLAPQNSVPILAASSSPPTVSFDNDQNIGFKFFDNFYRNSSVQHINLRTDEEGVTDYCGRMDLAVKIIGCRCEYVTKTDNTSVLLLVIPDANSNSIPLFHSPGFSDQSLDAAKQIAAKRGLKMLDALRQ